MLQLYHCFNYRSWSRHLIKYNPIMKPTSSHVLSIRLYMWSYWKRLNLQSNYRCVTKIFWSFYTICKNKPQANLFELQLCKCSLDVPIGPRVELIWLRCSFKRNHCGALICRLRAFCQTYKPIDDIVMWPMTHDECVQSVLVYTVDSFLTGTFIFH